MLGDRDDGIRRRRSRRCGLSVCAAALSALAWAAPALAAPTPITDCASTAGLRAAVAAGGSYAFACDGTIPFNAEPEIVVTKDVTIDATGHSVRLDGSSRAGRIFRVAAKKLTLTGGLLLDGGHVVGTGGGAAVSGTTGANGSSGVDYGEAGGGGTPGTSGTSAPPTPPAGPSSEGGCLYVAAGAAAVLDGVSLINCSANGAHGAPGGAGGNGGSGGDGANGPPAAATGGGSGGSGARGGNGGNGSNGGEARGGAVYNAGTLTVIGSHFGSNTAAGGIGGAGGAGGSGGHGGMGGAGGIDPSVMPHAYGANAPGGDGAGAGSGGRGGAGGAGKGGAIYNAGVMTVTGGSDFTGNTAKGGGFVFEAGGAGGHGGDGGGGGGHGFFYLPGQPPGGSGGSGGNGGQGGSGGNGGDAAGGAIYAQTGGPPPSPDTSFSGNGIEPGVYPGGSAMGAGAGGAAGGGASGGYGDDGLTTGPHGANGFAGGNGAPGFAGIGSDPDSRTVKPASIALTIASGVPAGGIGTGDVISVQVTVKVTGAQVDGIRLTGLTASGAATVTSSPAGTSGFSLGPGQSRTFTYGVRGAQAGTATLAASVDGSGPGGQPVHAAASTSFPVAERALRITVAPTPKTITLKADDKGRLGPRKIKVRVRLANTTTAKLKNVQLLSLNPVPADPTQRLDQLALPKKTLPLKIGTINGGDSVTKTFSLKVTGDGTYVFNALALYDNPRAPNGNGRSTAKDGRFTVKAPLLFFAADLDTSDANARGEVTVKGGDSWYVTGRVRNLSSFRTVCLSPLTPKWGANTGGLGPHQIGVVPIDEPAPPMAGPVAPGKTISFLLHARTSPDGGTRSSVTLKPRVTLGETGDDCNVLVTDAAKPIAASLIKTAPDSSAFSVHVDTTKAPQAGSGLLEFFGAYGKGAYKSLAKVYAGGVALASEYGSLDKMVAAFKRIDPANWARRASEALSSMTHAMSLAANFWISATPAERAAFLRQVSGDFVDRSKKVWAGVEGAVQKSAEGWFDSVVRAYYDGDTTAMFKTLGASAGEGLTDTAIDMAKFELGLAVLKKAGTLTRIFVRVGDESVLVKRLKDMPPGKLLSFTEMRGLWGLAKSDLEAFTAIAKEEGVLIGVRGRAVESVANLEEGAVWKHENLKPKNVNSIDIDFLGFDQADHGLVAFRTYTSAQKQAILRKIAAAGLDAEQTAAALDRAKTRFGEIRYLSKIEQFSKAGEIDVGFNYAENGLAQETTDAKRAFSLDGKDLRDPTGRDPLRKGGVYYRPLQENPALDALAQGTGKLPAFCRRLLAKVLCRVTGDMDGVYLTDAAGQALSEAKRLKVYKRLAAAGWQHPETLTWINKERQFLFGAKNKILAGLELGREPMMEFGPDGLVRATFLNLKKSKLFSTSEYFLNIVGGYTSLR